MRGGSPPPLIHPHTPAIPPIFYRGFLRRNRGSPPRTCRAVGVPVSRARGRPPLTSARCPHQLELMGGAEGFPVANAVSNGGSGGDRGVWGGSRCKASLRGGRPPIFVPQGLLFLFFLFYSLLFNSFYLYIPPEIIYNHRDKRTERTIICSK